MQVMWGLRITRARRALGLQGVELASATGVLKTTLHNWETGRAPVPAWWLYRLHELYGVDPNYILLGRLDCLPAEMAKKIQLQVQN